MFANQNKAKKEQQQGEREMKRKSHLRSSMEEEGEVFQVGEEQREKKQKTLRLQRTKALSFEGILQQKNTRNSNTKWLGEGK